MYCRHKFWNLTQPWYQALYLHDQKVRTAMSISQEQKSFSGGVKRISHHF